LDGTFPTEYRFTGQLLDGYSNLYLMGARQYDPQLGRWASPDTMVPDPTNPQSLSRYSYVRAAPLRYSDPSGRREEGECGFEGDPCPDSSPSPTSLSEAEIEALLDFLVQAILEEYGSVDDLEALALISDLVAIYYPNWDGYLSEMSSIFLGTDLYGPGTLIAALAAGGCGGIGREQHDCMANEHYFLDKGFHPDFQDGHNQPYHAWAYVAQTAAPGSPAAYTTGRLMGIVANTVHEPLQSRLGMVDGWGTSWQDYVLSESAMSIGLVVSAEAVTPYKLGDTMRFAFGAKGPGSSGKLQKLVGRWGRLRGMQ
jgi:RHS repeat-associated protein